LRKRSDVCLPRAKKVKEINASTLAGFRYAQEREVFLNALLRGTAQNDLPKSGERLDSVFGIVVVPGHTVITKKGE
jgi:hypothetical protein